MTIETKTTHRWYQDLSVVRWIFVIMGILVMMFAGGCSINVLATERMNAESVGIVALIGGIPFAGGLLIWWLAAKVGRTPQ